MPLNYFLAGTDCVISLCCLAVVLLAAREKFQLKARRWSIVYGAVVLLALAGCSEIGRDVEGVVLAMEGRATLQRPGEKDSRSLSLTTHFAAGDVMTTSSDGRLRLMFLPGTLGTLDPDSELQVEQLRMAKNGDAMVNPMRMRRGRVRLTRGGLTALVETSATPDVDLTVETPKATIVARSGSTFGVEVNSGKIRVNCVRGTLEVRSNGGMKVMKAGFFAEVDGATAVSAADSDANAEDQVLKILVEQETLSSLENGQRFAPAPWRKRE